MGFSHLSLGPNRNFSPHEIWQGISPGFLKATHPPFALHTLNRTFLFNWVQIL